MNLEECLRAIETGMAGQEHADWLRDFYIGNKSTLNKALVRVWQCDEQIGAVHADTIKVALECRELQAELDSLQAKLKQGGISPERRCWTCRHYAPPLVACAKLHSDAVLKCVNNNWWHWEARDD